MKAKTPTSTTIVRVDPADNFPISHRGQPFREEVSSFKPHSPYSPLENPGVSLSPIPKV